jgi:hypothetical protein
MWRPPPSITTPFPHDVLLVHAAIHATHDPFSFSSSLRVLLYMLSCQIPLHVALPAPIGASLSDFHLEQLLLLYSAIIEGCLRLSS